MEAISVIIVVRAESSLHEVRLACERHGLTQVQEIPRLSILRGLIERNRLPELGKIPGISSIEREREIQLPPRRSPIQYPPPLTVGPFDWKGHYRIEGAAFVYTDRDTGRTTTILGYPTEKPCRLALLRSLRFRLV
jgi:hypothetical protein